MYFNDNHSFIVSNAWRSDSMKRPHEAGDLHQSRMEHLIEDVTPQSMFRDTEGEYLPVRDWPGVRVESTAKRCTIAFHSID